MSETGQDASAVPQREAEDDHDLLTYGEVRVRLYQEVEAQRALVAELEAAAGPAGNPEPAAAAGTGGPADVTHRLARERTRLTALREALERNSRQPINEENFERFFGYKGTPRRNT